MKIKYLGHSCFKISGKSDSSENITIITDPFDPKAVGLSLPQQEADIITISHDHSDHNFVDKVKAKDERLFVADTPGEYEVNDLRIYGIKSYHDDTEGKERGLNNIFVYDFQEARVAHLGDLGHGLTSDQIEELENVEILIVPIGGIYTIDAKKAWEVVEDLEPLFVIPMHFRTDKHLPTYKDLATIDDFISKAGIKIEERDELNVKGKEDLPTTPTIIKLSY